MKHINLNSADEQVKRFIQALPLEPGGVELELDGKVICKDTRRVRIVPLANNEVYMDFDITLKATEGPVTFGDTKEGTMGIRTRPELRLEGKVAKGHILNSDGLTDRDCWGKRAAWVDYYGPVNGKTVGITMFEHPSSPRHPTWWHAREYGLFAANPFGIHDFEKKPAGTGDLVLEKDKEWTLRYRIYFHHDHLSREALQKHFEEYKAL